jgi:PAS domain S-box-containing protein
MTSREGIFAGGSQLEPDDRRPITQSSWGAFEAEAPVGLLTLTPDLHVLEANRAWTRLIGRELADVVGKPIRDVMAFEDAHALARHCELCLREHRAVATDLRFLAPGGEWRVVELLSTPVAVGDETVVASACRDVTTRADAAGWLNLLATLGERLLGVLDLGEVAARLTRVLVPGFADACAVYWDAHEGEDACDREQVESQVQRIAALHGANERPAPWADAEVEARLRAACEKTLRTAAPQRIVVGELSGLVVPLSSASATHGALLLLHGQRAQGDSAAWQALAEEIGRRASLAFDAARRHRGSERAVEARDQRIAMLAHDLRNALGSASMNCQLLNARELPESPARRQLGAIARSVTWMTELVEDLLEHRALEDNPVAIEWQALDAVALCREAVTLHESAASARDVRLVIDDAGAGTFVRADRCRVIQVLDNLIANALVASPAQAEVVVRVEPRGERVRFSITDRGPGIALRERDAAALFRGTLKRAEPGGRSRGLGLPIAHALVRALGGRIWVESQPGLGSTFFFTLPAYL